MAAGADTRGSGHAKAADLASALGAMVLGGGLALLAPVWLRGHALALLAVGIVVHGVGMSLRYRLDRQERPPTAWERALFWLCWACLAGLGAWIAVGRPPAG